MDKKPYKASAKYVLHEHDATNLHWDLRFEIPNRSQIASFALPKMKIPSEPGERYLALRMNDHSRLWLQFEGKIDDDVYGAGDIKILERGTMDIMGYSKKYITLRFNKPTKYFKKAEYILIKMKPRHKKEDEWIFMMKKSSTISEQVIDFFVNMKTKFIK